jgi:hypothetical protein
MTPRVGFLNSGLGSILRLHPLQANLTCSECSPSGSGGRAGSQARASKNATRASPNRVSLGKKERFQAFALPVPYSTVSWSCRETLCRNCSGKTVRRTIDDSTDGWNDPRSPAENMVPSDAAPTAIRRRIALAAPREFSAPCAIGSGPQKFARRPVATNKAEVEPCLTDAALRHESAGPRLSLLHFVPTYGSARRMLTSLPPRLCSARRLNRSTTEQTRFDVDVMCLLKLRRTQ